MTTSINKNSLLISSNQSTKTLVFNPSDYSVQTEYDTQAIQCISPLPATYKFLQFDGFFTLEKGTNLISYYHWNKKFPISKFSVNEELLSIITSTSGEYLIGGGVSGQLYIWQIATGRLVSQLQSHKKSITSLKITKDGRWLATGSSDSTIKVYSFNMLLTSNLPSYKPQYSLPHHSLSITDLHIGTGNIHHSKLYSSSIDNSLQIHQLSTGQLSANIQMPNIINTLFVDILERYIYCGLENCQIVILDSRCNFQQTTLIGHSHPVTSLYLSIDGTRLFSGDKGGFLLEWDLNTKKLANSIQLFKDQPITHLVHVDVPVDSEFTPAPFQKTPSIGKFQASVPNFYPANFEDGLPSDLIQHILKRRPQPYADKSDLFPNKQDTELQKGKLENKLEELNSDFESLTLKYLQAKAQSGFFEDKN